MFRQSVFIFGTLLICRTFSHPVEEHSRGHASATGGGKVVLGELSADDFASSNSGPLSASGFASSSVLGSGQGASIISKASSISESGRKVVKRQSVESADNADAKFTALFNAVSGDITNSLNSFATNNKDVNIAFQNAQTSAKGQNVSLTASSSASASSKQVKRHRRQSIFEDAEVDGVAKGQVGKGSLQIFEDAFTRTDTKGSHARGSQKGVGLGSAIREDLVLNASALFSQQAPGSRLSSASDQSAFGRGSVSSGGLTIENRDEANADRFGSSGFAADSAKAFGSDIMFNGGASSDSKFKHQRSRRQSLIEQEADADSFGKESVKLGSLSSSHKAQSKTDKGSAFGSASAMVDARGEGIQVEETVKSNSQSLFRLRRQANQPDLDTDSHIHGSATGSVDFGSIFSKEEGKTMANKDGTSGQISSMMAAKGNHAKISHSIKSDSDFTDN